MGSVGMVVFYVASFISYTTLARRVGCLSVRRDSLLRALPRRLRSVSMTSSDVTGPALTVRWIVCERRMSGATAVGELEEVMRMTRVTDQVDAA